MENIFWILAAIAVIGVVIWYLKSKKKGPASMNEPEEPTPPPSPSSSSENPEM